jgi:hypothetical protein
VILVTLFAGSLLLKHPAGEAETMGTASVGGPHQRSYLPVLLQQAVGSRPGLDNTVAPLVGVVDVLALRPL